MSLDINEVCIDLVNDNKKFDDEIEFLKKNYNKIYTDSKCFYESYVCIIRMRVCRHVCTYMLRPK
jgi:hypothetical protein